MILAAKEPGPLDDFPAWFIGVPLRIEHGQHTQIGASRGGAEHDGPDIDPSCQDFGHHRRIGAVGNVLNLDIRGS